MHLRRRFPLPTQHRARESKEWCTGVATPFITVAESGAPQRELIMSFRIALFAVLAACVSLEAMATTVIHAGNVTTLSNTLPDANDLWVLTDDIPKVNGFVLKPEGMCRDDICIPLRQDEDSDLVLSRSGKKWLSLTQFARNLKQAYARDLETDTWSFGDIPLTRDRFLHAAMAPDFELQDRQGKSVRLSDFRGKKVMLVTWASWCGCRLDVAAWQPIYEELKGQNFELISVAEDTAGEAAAGPIIDAAKPTYTTLIDTKHRISALYDFVNVPSAAWIDESGRIVRINEGTYAKTHKLGTTTIGTDTYTPALRDWVAKGSKSQHVWTAQQVTQKIRGRSSDEAKADVLFALGTYFYDQKNEQKAGEYWGQARGLFPDSWNIHRQDWSITDRQNAGRNYQQKRQALEKPYYRDLELK
jgi:peroxiredoxin